MKENGLSRRDFLRLSALITAGAALAACAPATPEVVEVEQPTEKPAEEPTEAPVAPEPITVIYWDPSRTDAEIVAMEEVYFKFEDAQDQYVLEILHGKNEEALLTSVSAGNPPDVYWRWSPGTWGSWINKGVVLDVTPYVEASELDWDRFVPVSLELMQWDGRWYGLPLTSAGVALILWNKPMFEQAGLDPEVPPETWDDLIEFSDKLTVYDSAGEITVLGFDGMHVASWEWPLLNNAKYYDAEAGELTPTDPGLVGAYEWMASYWEHRGVDQMDRFRTGVPTSNYYSEAHPLCTDAVAMASGYEWDPLYMTFECEWDKFGFARMAYPTGHPEYPVYSQGAIALCIPTGAAEPDGGWAFMEFMQTWEAAAGIGTALINTAQVTDAVNDPEYRDNEVLRLCTELSKNAAAFPCNIPVAAEYSTELGKAYDLVVHGQASAEEALQEVYDLVQPMLEEALA